MPDHHHGPRDHDDRRNGAAIIVHVYVNDFPTVVGVVDIDPNIDLDASYIGLYDDGSCIVHLHTRDYRRIVDHFTAKRSFDATGNDARAAAVAGERGGDAAHDADIINATGA